MYIIKAWHKSKPSTECINKGMVTPTIPRWNNSWSYLHAFQWNKSIPAVLLLLASDFSPTCHIHCTKKCQNVYTNNTTDVQWRSKTACLCARFSAQFFEGRYFIFNAHSTVKITSLMAEMSVYHFDSWWLGAFQAFDSGFNICRYSLLITVPRTAPCFPRTS